MGKKKDKDKDVLQLSQLLEMTDTLERPVLELEFVAGNPMYYLVIKPGGEFVNPSRANNQLGCLFNLNRNTIHTIADGFKTLTIPTVLTGIGETDPVITWRMAPVGFSAFINRDSERAMGDLYWSDHWACKALAIRIDEFLYGVNLKTFKYELASNLKLSHSRENGYLRITEVFDEYDIQDYVLGTLQLVPPEADTPEGYDPTCVSSKPL